MRKRLPIRRSRAATFSRFAGVVAIPVVVIGALLHRGGHIDSTALFAILAVGFALALVAVAAGVGALAAVWRDGARGTGAAIRGLFFGLIALSPAIVVAGAAIYYPRLTDVSTDLETPPKLALSKGDTKPGGHLRPQVQRAAYPDIVPRRFPVGTAQLYRAVEQVIKERGWTIAAHLAPAMNDDPAAIQIETHSLVLGFVDDVTVRILPDPIGARLDIRSASRTGAHDLGVNARRIRDLLASVDAVLTEAYGITEVQESDTAPVEVLPDDFDKPAEPEIPVPGDKPQSGDPAVSG
ncbi:uncharacterized protein DUF1499 [Breoghania corrubedonensis]|uniref:Uncharacterized protein DUF1499 n=1 Tax=Breoghania corrubedonensis TaxID=665038 RepID=A0A2T5VEH2_9HYPH|nr:DUF1499 domain-containing protein [Breoghania corrubedonensis]PTW62158.1 uncharacterized protein DUF1499 [Breoghania corrubedonensis]